MRGLHHNEPSSRHVLSPQRLRSRVGFSCKIHFKTDFDGLPIAFHLTGGEVSDSTQLTTSLEIGPDIRPRAAMTDKGMMRKQTALPAVRATLFLSSRIGRM
jgi:hypothetical protein